MIKIILPSQLTYSKNYLIKQITNIYLEQKTNLDNHKK